MRACIYGLNSTDGVVGCLSNVDATIHVMLHLRPTILLSSAENIAKGQVYSGVSPTRYAFLICALTMRTNPMNPTALRTKAISQPSLVSIPSPSPTDGSAEAAR